jgi:hypothetical protein
MPDIHDLLERRASSHEPTPDLFERVLDRRRRRDRSRRIVSAVVGVAVAAVATGGLMRVISTEQVPAAPPWVPFVGRWNSTELGFGGSAKTMTIGATEDGVLHLTVHDESSDECSDRQTRVDHVDTPSTMTAEARLVDATTLVASAPVLTCDGGREPNLAAGDGYTVVLDPATGRLFDDLGDSWHRGAPPLRAGDESTKSVGPGSYSFLGGDVTFRADGPWSDHVEAYIDDRLFLLLGEDGAQIYIIANPTPVALDHPCATDLLPTSAANVVDAVRSNPNFEVATPVAERVGGIDALRMDVAPTLVAGPCNSAFPVVSSSRVWGVVTPTQMGRLYLLDLPGGSARALAILIIAPEAGFERAVQAAAPVVASFGFRAE